MSSIPPLDWQTFLTTWSWRPGWLVVCGLAAVTYVVGLRRAASSGPLPVSGWRVASFGSGLAVLVWCLSSGVDAYAMSLFWMHMVEHLTLITVVPALIVLGHPLTVLVAAVDTDRRARLERSLTRGPIALLTHPAIGLATYGAVIFFAHLTPLMDQMAQHPWLVTAEQVAYLLSGWMLLVCVIGEEPLRWRTPYLLRLVFLVLAMIPDTLVGIVLLQTPTEPFPTYAAMRPAWATPALHDLDIGGSLMWAAGDGLMMLLSIGVVVSLVSGRTQDRFLGQWLESARVDAFLHHVGADPSEGGLSDGPGLDDSDRALAAYNDMLRRRAAGE